MKLEYIFAFSASEILSLYELEAAPVFTPLNDSNFFSAINLWFTDEANATETYGYISDWNVSAVTNMSFAFDGRSEFNDDIGSWDAFSVQNMKAMLAVRPLSMRILEVGMFPLSRTCYQCSREQLHSIRTSGIGMFLRLRV